MSWGTTDLYHAGRARPIVRSYACAKEKRGKKRWSEGSTPAGENAGFLYERLKHKEETIVRNVMASTRREAMIMIMEDDGDHTTRGQFQTAGRVGTSWATHLLFPVIAQNLILGCARSRG
jgi:hypothetical protein